MEIIDKFLSEIKEISDKKNESLELSKKAGNNFNILSVIGLKSEEVRLHSAFIAELLNPEGAHGQKNLFLKAFSALICSRAIPSKFFIQASFCPDKTFNEI